jgi:predicted nucleic acid-binding protein
MSSAQPPLSLLCLVLDMNIVVADLLCSGPPRRLIEWACKGEAELFSSPVLLDELAHTLGYSKFGKRVERFDTNTRR